MKGSDKGLRTVQEFEFAREDCIVFISHSGSRYEIRLGRDKKAYCTCPGGVFWGVIKKEGKEAGCKHLRDFVEAGLLKEWGVDPGDRPDMPAKIEDVERKLIGDFSMPYKRKKRW